MSGACHWATHWATQTRILRLLELLVAHWCAASLLLLASPPLADTHFTSVKAARAVGHVQGLPRTQKVSQCGQGNHGLTSAWHACF
jgi:hypothetical protein